MTEQITAGTEPWHDGQVLDVLAVMDALTMAVAAQTLFAAEVDKPTFIERQQCARDVLTGMARRVVIPVELLDKIPTRGNHRFDQARNCLRHHTGQPITNYRRAGIDHRNLLSMLLAARDDNGQGLADSEIHAFRMRLRQRRRDPRPGARGSGLGTGNVCLRLSPDWPR
jgi:cytochrome P450